MCEILLQLDGESVPYPFCLQSTKLQRVNNVFMLYVITNTIICFSQVHLRPPESVDVQHREKIKRRGFIRGWKIVMRDIVTLIKPFGFCNTRQYTTVTNQC